MNGARPGLPFGLVIMILVLIADQVSKFLVTDFMASRGFEPFAITAHFSLVTVWNRGISFGMLSTGDDALRWTMTVVAFGAAAGLVIWMRGLTDRWQMLAAGLVAGGAVGNGVDRIVHGAVADFIDLHVGQWSWPAFNVADAAITTGVAILVLNALLTSRSGRRMTP